MVETQIKKPQMSEAQMDQVSKDTGAELAKQAKVKVKLYLPPDEKQKLNSASEGGVNVPWPCETVIVNGYNYTIKRGIEVEVPQTVAEVLENAGMI